MNIPTARLRQLLRLLGEGYELSADPVECQRHLLDGVARLVGGVCVMRAQVHDYRPGGGFDVRHCVAVGLDEDHQRRLVDLQSRQVACNPSLARIMKRHDELAVQGVATALRQDIIDDHDWYGSAFVAEVRRPARVDGHIHSARLVGRAHADTLGVARAWGDPPFREDDRDVLRVFHAEVLGRFRSPGDGPPVVLPPAPGGRWTPRERATLELLLTGASEKQVAATLGLSRHTVHGYVKAIYAKLGVKSRAELMSCALAAHAERQSSVSSPTASDESGGGAIWDDGPVDALGSGDTSLRTRSARLFTPSLAYRRRT